MLLVRSWLPSPSAWVDAFRHLLPVAQGLDVIDPLREPSDFLSDRDLEWMHLQKEDLAIPYDVTSNWPTPLLASVGPLPGAAATVLLRSKPWRLRCQHSQILRPSGLVLHDPSNDWAGIHGRSWPLMPSRPLRGSVINLSNYGTANFYHWLYNPSLQILPLLEASGVNPDHCDALYLGPAWPDPWPSYVEESLDLLGLAHLPRLRKPVQPQLLYSAFRSASGCWPSCYQWSWLRGRLSTPINRTGRRLYVGRGSSSRRRLLNEPDLMVTLASLGFQCLQDPAAISFAEQRCLFAEADVIVAPHGAALTNLTFCRPGTKVLEFHNPTYLSPLYAVLASYGKLLYQGLMGSAVPNTQQRSMDDLMVDSDAVRLQLVEWGLS